MYVGLQGYHLFIYLAGVVGRPTNDFDKKVYCYTYTVMNIKDSIQCQIQPCNSILRHRNLGFANAMVYCAKALYPPSPAILLYSRPLAIP